MNQPRSIDEYIAAFPTEVQARLQEMRVTISKAAPNAEETISYRIPTFRLNGNLVHFAAFKNHVGFFPTSTGIKAFKKELAGYRGGKGSVQFPFDKPVPFGLVRRIVKFRVVENLERAEAREKQVRFRKRL